MPSETFGVGSPTSAAVSPPSKRLWLALHEVAFVLQVCEEEARREIDVGGLERSTVHETLRVGVESLEHLVARRVQQGVQSDLASWVLRMIAEGRLAAPRTQSPHDAPEALINAVAPIPHGRAALRPDASHRVPFPHLSYYGHEHVQRYLRIEA